MRLLILLISIILFISLCFYIFSPQIKRGAQSKNVPVLFIHGYLGSQKSLGKMIKRFEQNGWGTKVGYCVVQKDGAIQWKHIMKAKEGKLPLIHIVFKKPDASIAQQQKWIEAIIQDVRDTYKASSVDLVGHSMGGVTAAAVSLSNPQYIQKLVTLGSPIQGLDYQELMEMYPHARNHIESMGARDLAFHSIALNKLYESRQDFSKEIDVFSGAGDVGDKTDGVVTVESAYGLQEFTEHIHLQTFHEAHSDLHESSEVDKAVYQFLKRD
ncbi:alpha/beta fold hydrolase [Priestia megaterium]|uniref:alpha/beta fold hydrolase n=1 Tax=Priestia megaterium TaxID=1404 RepID=UPI0039C1E4E9